MHYLSGNETPKRLDEMIIEVEQDLNQVKSKKPWSNSKSFDHLQLITEREDYIEFLTCLRNKKNTK